MYNNINNVSQEGIDNMKARYRFLLLLASMGILAANAGCKRENFDNLLLYLPLDEGKGISISDKSGHLEEAELKYAYTNAIYMESQDPQWRKNGVVDGSLLFDGNSTYISYEKDQIQINGSAFSINLWFAPRTFEWDDPYSAENGTQHLTGLVSQCNKKNKTGFQLGYQRFGKLCFEVGTGEEWLTLWGEGNLNKYEWNCVTATFDGENGIMSLYLNGEMIGDMQIDKGTSVAASNRSLLIGKSSESQQLGTGYINMCSGLMDDVKIFSNALSSEEVKELYSNIEVPKIDFNDIWLQNILVNDCYKPQYHGGPYQYWMNEPHSPIYYNGKYHLFFQENMSGTYWRNICWGHLVSDDMVNWKPVKEAIVPTENSVVPDGVWSGNACLDKNGVPLIFFTAGNDAYADYGLISNQNIGVAYPKDLNDENLEDWIIYDKLAVIQQEGQGRTGEFRDPYVWRKENTWYMLICSGSNTSNGGSALLYKSDTLELLPDGTIDMDWKYVGPVYEMENQSMVYGTSWELPIITTVYNQDKTISKDVFIISPAPASSADNKIYYFVGQFNYETGKFIPDDKFKNAPAILDYGDNVFTGPSVIVDENTDEVTIFSIMQDQRSPAEQGASGWAHNVGLARNIWLNDDGSDLMISPIDNLKNIQGKELLNAKDLTIEDANKKLADIQGDMLYIKLTFAANDADKFGIRMLESADKEQYTSYYYQTNDMTIHGETTNRGKESKTGFVSGDLQIDNNNVTMEIYLDRSLVEGFFNDTKAISMRAYPDINNQNGISLFSENGDALVKEIYIAQMNSIYQ